MRVFRLGRQAVERSIFGASELSYDDPTIHIRTTDDGAR